MGIEQKVLRSLAAASFLISALPHPVLAQELLDKKPERFRYAMHNYPPPILVKTDLGMASISVERFCNEDASGGILISLHAGELDPKNGLLRIEVNPIIGNRINQQIVASTELKSPEQIARMTLKKDQPYMIYLIERYGQRVKTITSFDVVHYRWPILLIGAVQYERSPNFQEQNFGSLEEQEVEEPEEDPT